MPAYVHDPRHRHSWELRPGAELDARLRTLARELEDLGLVPPGESTKPRFHPHLTLLRSDRLDHDLLAELAEAIPAAVAFDSVGAFGDGRIAWLAPHQPVPLVAARTRLVESLGAAHVDPSALARDPWVPHVTLAYAVPEPHRAAVAEHLRAALPIRGAWATLECWDLDVRPTRRIHAAPLPDARAT